MARTLASPTTRTTLASIADDNVYAPVGVSDCVGSVDAKSTVSEDDGRIGGELG